MSVKLQVRLRRLVVISLIVGVLLHPESAQAATYVVSTTADAPHASPVDASCASTLPGNPCTLRAAVQAANFLGGANTINLALAGTYTLTGGELRFLRKRLKMTQEEVGRALQGLTIPVRDNP